MGSSSILWLATPLDGIRLLLAMGVAVSTAGSLGVDDVLSSNLGVPVAEAVDLDVVKVLLVSDSGVVGDVMARLASCDSLADSASGEEVGIDGSRGFAGVDEGPSCRGTIACLPSTGWGAFANRRLK